MNKLPYFELKVVKVKKEKKECIGEICIRGKRRPLYEKDHYIYFEGKDKSKGNWVNGENLNAIKFPVPCRYNGNYLGLIYIARDKSYGLINIDKQRKYWCVEDSGWENLGNMIRSYDIHILKGKIIIFENEESK